MSEETIIHATAKVTIEAAAGSDKPPRVTIEAYNGGLMQPPGWPALAVELSGVTLPKSVPILADHRPEISGIIGHGEAIIRAGQLSIEGSLSDATEAGKQVLALARSGFPFQASIGLKPTERNRIDDGETVVVNGKPITAPAGGFLHITAGTLQEVSILPLGADSSTSVSVAASQKGVSSMSTNGATEERTPEQLESERVSGILKIQAQYQSEQRDNPQFAAIAATAIEERWDLNQAELEMLKASRPMGGPPNIHVSRGNSTRLRVNQISAGILRLAGMEDVAETHFGEQALHASARIESLRDVCSECLRAEGRTVPTGTDEIIRASFSTEALPTVLGTTVGRSMIQPFLDVTSNWRSFATIKSAATFKPQKSARPSSFQTLEEIGADGEIKHTTLEEDGAYDWQVDTFARMIGITRQTIVNDDLGFISEYGPLLGQAAGRSLNDLIYSTIMGGEAAGFFSSGNSNFLEAGSDLDIASLDLGVQTMKKQVDARGYNIDNKPACLLVPAELETTGSALLNSTEIVTGSDTTKPNGNPVRNIVSKLEAEARLSNTDRFTGASATAWYLFGGPMSHALIVGFLRNMQTPTVEVQQADFRKLGIQMRVYFDYGVALGDPRGALKATGAS